MFSVPFKNAKAIAEAVLDLNKDLRSRESIEREAYKYGRVMTWSSVALAYLDLFSLVLKTKTVR